MSRKKNSKVAHDGIKVVGMFRVQITEDDLAGGKRIVGDSGWRKNQVTNLGINQYIGTWLASGSGGKAVTHAALGTGSAPASNATTLDGELGHASNDRASVSTSIVSSRTVQFTAAWASSDSVVTATANISNIGLFNTSTTQVGTLFAGNTYTSSALATNQNVNATYQIRFVST